jgi:hypothetical protein
MENRHRDHDAESEIIRQVKEHWSVGVGYIGEPCCAALFLIDKQGRITCLLRERPTSDSPSFAFDILELAPVMQFVSAKGKKLLLVACYPNGLQYVAWKPGVAEFHPYISGPEESEPDDEYWAGVIPEGFLRILLRRKTAGNQIYPSYHAHTKGLIVSRSVWNHLGGGGALVGRIQRTTKPTSWHWGYAVRAMIGNFIATQSDARRWPR